MASSYRCIELDPTTGLLKLEHRAFPKLRSNEVFVRVWGSPINPSDRLFCQGVYGLQINSPIVPGFEGTGTVVETGNSVWARRLLGKRVSGGVQGRDGFWAEYVVLPVNQCLPIAESIQQETAACAFVNPLTALALMDPLRKRKYGSFVQTAAASQLGRMVQRLSKRYKIPGIHIVHRSDLKEALINEGFERVLDSSSSTFEEDLKRFSEELDARYAIDSVAGSMTGLLAKNLPSKSQIVVYGVLSGKKCEVDPGDLIFRGVQITGFWLSDLLKEKNPLKSIKLLSDLKKHLNSEVATVVSRRIQLNEVIEEIKSPKGSSSFGKTLVVPN